MKRLITLTGLLILINTCLSGQTVFIPYSIPNVAPYSAPGSGKTGSIMLKGQITFDDLFKAPSYYWMKKEADEYIPDETAIKDMERTMSRYTILVFIGTWDKGSMELLPKLYKVLQEADMQGPVTLYAADTNRVTGKGAEIKYSVISEPTVIVLDGDNEIGKIAGNVKISLEYDLADIGLKYLRRTHND